MARRTSLLAFALVAAACGVPAEPAPEAPFGNLLAEAPPPPPIDEKLAAEGERLYLASCAACHGVDLAGDPNWKIPRDDGTYPPPPHDASGHTWHHPTSQLVDIVLSGTTELGGTMPGFAGRLDEEQIRAILEYFRTTWTPEQRAYQWQATWQAEQRDNS